ncbi:hypothetical protein SDC9_176176 [bioreactor metagenome]|uniref:Uncharacterized protein n=1 Tax=bioreactor metagenome TaxID=1076179 RepID=A0A645GP93_9ZZZZ
MLGVIGAHKRELEQVLGGALGGGPAVDEHGAAVARRDHRSHGRPADTPDPVYQQRGGGEEGPCAPGGDEGVADAVFQQIEPHRKGGVFLLLEGGGGVVTHLHDLIGVGDLQPRRQVAHALFGQRAEDILTPAHQDDLHPILLDRIQRAPDIAYRRVVASHGVHDDLHTLTLHSEPLQTAASEGSVFFAAVPLSKNQAVPDAPERAETAPHFCSACPLPGGPGAG